MSEAGWMELQVAAPQAWTPLVTDKLEGDGCSTYQYEVMLGPVERANLTLECVHSRGRRHTLYGRRPGFPSPRPRR